MKKLLVMAVAMSLLTGACATLFKGNSSKLDMNSRTEYEKSLSALNQKNVDLKKRMVDYKQNGETKWSSFKSEFNNDMDDFGKELKDFTVDNK